MANGNGLLRVVRKKDGNLVPFNRKKIVDAIFAAAEVVSGSGGADRAIAEKVADRAVQIIGERRIRIPTHEDLTKANIDALREMGYDGTANAYEIYAHKRRKVDEELRILGQVSGGSTTDQFLMVSSTSDEMSHSWDRQRIIESLIAEADVDLDHAKRVAKSIENTVVLSGIQMITTSLVRELAHTEMLRLGLRESAERYKTFGIPRADLESTIGTKNRENANIRSNNPEAVGYTVSGRTFKEFALAGGVFSPEVADAHTKGEVHIHNLEAPVRVYCSSHSLEYLKKFGLKLENLQSSSGPAKHARTLTGHLNTFLASMQAYYAGALGIGYMNIFYAPLIESDLEDEGENRIDFAERRIARLKEKGKGNPDLEKLLEQEEKELAELKGHASDALIEEEIQKLLVQEEQYKEFSASQNAFSRGGQTLFLDFNMHTGVPEYLRDTLAIGPGGKYMMRKKGRRVFLEERKLEEKTADGRYHLMELVDPETGRVVIKERVEFFDPKTGKSVDADKLREEEKDITEEISRGRLQSEVIQDRINLQEGEKILTYGDYDGLAKKILKAAMKVWKKGDSRGAPFPFPKFDLHVNKDSFTDPKQRKLLEEACEMASENGSPYFIFDRDEVTLSACCRLRTAVEDNYVLKHPESMRFCGFLNVTLNLPQAAYRAVRSGKKSLDGLLEEIDKTMDTAVKAHLEKRDFVKSLQQPGLPQWQTGMPSEDGQPYVDVDRATYILGLIGLNDAMKVICGKELHELDARGYEDALKVVAHMNLRAKEYGKKHGLKFSLEETPAESASRRLAKSDLARFSEAKNTVNGGEEPYYTNSIHFKPDAPVDLVTRIKGQSMFHPAIESGAIVHAFIGEEKPSPEAIYSLVEKLYKNTQCAQITISPEFTICKKCNTTHRGLKDTCPDCGNSEKALIEHMTRIVGYFSTIEEWNPSKQAELKDRHNGRYSITGPDRQYVELPALANNNGDIRAVVIGKSDCKVCDDASRMLYNVSGKAEKDLGRKMSIDVYKADSEEGLVNLMVAGVNPSRLPAVVLVGKDGKVLLRHETEYRDRKANMIGARTVMDAVGGYNP